MVTCLKDFNLCFNCFKCTQGGLRPEVTECPPTIGDTIAIDWSIYLFVSRFLQLHACHAAMTVLYLITGYVQTLTQSQPNKQGAR